MRIRNMYQNLAAYLGYMGCMGCVGCDRMCGMCRMCTMWDGMALLLIRFWDMGYGSSCFIMFHHVSRLKKSRPNQYL